MSKVLLIIILTCLSLSSLGQDVYDTDSAPYQLSSQDYWLLGSGAVLNGVAYLIREDMDAPTIADLNALNRNDINILDRTATYNWSPTASDWSDRTELASILFPLIILQGSSARKDWFTVGVIFTETMAINQGLTDMSKSLTKRYRPFAYDELAPLDSRLSKNARHSFYSGHTSASAALCYFTATVFSDYYPDSALKPYVWATAISLPAVTGILRYEAGKHYVTDVIMGYLMGSLTGCLIPRMHKPGQRIIIGSARNSSGVHITYRF